MLRYCFPTWNIFHINFKKSLSWGSPQAQVRHSGRACVWGFGHLADPCKKQVLEVGNEIHRFVNTRTPREALGGDWTSRHRFGQWPYLCLRARSLPGPRKKQADTEVNPLINTQTPRMSKNPTTQVPCQKRCLWINFIFRTDYWKGNNVNNLFLALILILIMRDINVKSSW